MNNVQKRARKTFIYSKQQYYKQGKNKKYTKKKEGIKLPLLKPRANKNEIKRGKAKLKQIMGGRIFNNLDFVKLMEANNITDTYNAWGNINQKAKQEIENGTLTYENIEERLHQLVLEESPNNRLITLEEVNANKTNEEKRDILAKGKLPIQIPYQSSGVGDVAIGAAVLGRDGAILGAFNEGEIKWKSTELIFLDKGISIKSTGGVLLYEDVKTVVVGDKGLLRTMITILTNTGNDFVCKVFNNDLEAFKTIIEDNITSKEENITQDESDNADALLKYAELYEKGLITREEFDLKKEQLLYSNEPVTDNKIVYCSNCGEAMDHDSNFCTKCGSEIIKH